MCIRDRVMDTEKEIVEEDAQGDQPDKAEARREPNWQEMMRFIAKKFDKIDENFKKHEEISSCLLYTSRCV